MAEETCSSEGPQCPYCGRQYTADEPHYFDEHNFTEDECDSCGKKFSVCIHTSVAWSCEPIDDDGLPTAADVRGILGPVSAPGESK